MDLPGGYYSVSGAQAGGLDWLIVTIAYVFFDGLLYCRGSVGGCGVLFSGILVIGITDPRGWAGYGTGRIWCCGGYGRADCFGFVVRIEVCQTTSKVRETLPPIEIAER
jgi:hypothetical protein